MKKQIRMLCVALACVLAAMSVGIFAACNPAIEGKDNLSLPLVVADVRQTGGMRLATTVNNTSQGATLTVTVLPDSALDKTVDWSLAWDTHSCNRADCCSKSPVTDYIKLAPTSDGACTASVTVLKKFWVTAVVTVTSRADDTVSAQCKLQYAARYDATSVKLSEEEQDDEVLLDLFDPDGDDWPTTVLGDFDPTALTQAKNVYYKSWELYLCDSHSVGLGTTKPTNLKVRIQIDDVPDELFSALRAQGFNPVSSATLEARTLTSSSDYRSIVSIQRIIDAITGCELMPRNASDETILANIIRFNAALAANDLGYDFLIGIWISSDYQEDTWMAVRFNFARTASCFTASEVQFADEDVVL